jgi:hypothetical protein
MVQKKNDSKRKNIRACRKTDIQKQTRKTEELIMGKKTPTALMLIVGLIAIISARTATADSAIDFASYALSGS